MHEDEIIKAAATEALPAVFVCVNLHNLKPFNALLGHDRGDQLIALAQQQLSAIGRTWRTRGDEFVALAEGTLAAVTPRVRAFSWLLHTTFGATEAWWFRFADGRASPTIPYRSFLVECTPRCGLAELGPDVSESLNLARRRCDELRDPNADTPLQGFAPLAFGHWTNETRLASPACPCCGHGQPTILDVDLGWARERCSACRARYERIDLVFVLGEQSEAGYA